MAFSGFWKVALIIGIILSLVAFILGWIGFGVPDWHKFRRYNNSAVEFYGLWAYCQDQNTVSGTVCKRWPTAEDELFGGSRPSFVRAAEGLITAGMIMLSLGLFVAVLAAALPFLAYLAGILALIAFILLVIGLPIFGRQSNSLSRTRNDYEYNKRYGFWLIVPTIVLEFLATLFFLLAGALYQRTGYGNIASGIYRKQPGYDGMRNIGPTVYGGRQVAGPANVLSAPPTYGAPYPPMPPPVPLPPPLPMAAPPSPVTSDLVLSPYASPQLSNRAVPSLLSQYLAQRSPQLYGPTVVRSSVLTALPQPSIISGIASSPIPGVTPAYLRMGDPVGPRFNPIINLSGETIIGPIQRST